MLGGELLGQILGALSDPPDGRPHIGGARFDGAEFSSDVSFNGAVFSGSAGFAGAKFSGHAWFDDGVKFGGDACFDGAEFIFVASFDGAEFSRDASFGGTAFRRVASFNGAAFSGVASFDGTAFRRVAAFDGAKFSSSARFDGAKFSSFASFRGVEFRGVAQFGSAKFSGYVWFDGAAFGEVALFENARLSGGAQFEGAEFSSDARFRTVRVEEGLSVGPSVIGGVLDLCGLRAGGEVRVVAAAREVRCEGAEFGGRVWLSLQGGELSLADSVFVGPVTVESPLEPIQSAIRGRVPGFSSQVVLRSLRGTDAEHLTLVDVDLGRCVLSGLRRPELLRLDGRCVFTPVPGGWCVRWGWMPWRWMERQALFEEHVWRRSMGAPAAGDGWAASDEPAEGDTGRALGVVGPARLAVLYRQLRAAVEGARNEPGAADLYYGEMEMRRLGHAQRGERWLLGAYWLVSGYGLRAWRALAVLTLLVLAAAVTLDRGGFPGRSPGLVACLLYAAGSVVSLNVVVRHVPGVLTEWGAAVRLVLRVGGPALLGLAVLAVRGRVKR